jgi:DNA-binding phage protein
MLALRHVAQAQGGVAAVARKAKLTREATYKMLSKVGNPELRSLRAVLAATGLRLAVKPIEKAARARPKNQSLKMASSAA